MYEREYRYELFDVLLDRAVDYCPKGSTREFADKQALKRSIVAAGNIGRIVARAIPIKVSTHPLKEVATIS